jgi:hypothetical protein
MKLRFSIRDLLWLTLVVALAVGWWIDHQQLSPKMSRTYPHSPFVQEEDSAVTR